MREPNNLTKKFDFLFSPRPFSKLIGSICGVDAQSCGLNLGSALGAVGIYLTVDLGTG